MTRFLIEEQRRHKDATGNFTALVNDIRLACKRIATLIGKGALAARWRTRERHGEAQKKLDVLANDMLATTNGAGSSRAWPRRRWQRRYVIPAEYPRGRYLLLFDPLDGSSNIDVNVSVGTIFSVLRCPEGVSEPKRRALPAAGRRQVAPATRSTARPRCWC